MIVYRHGEPKDVVRTHDIPVERVEDLPIGKSTWLWPYLNLRAGGVWARGYGFAGEMNPTLHVERVPGGLRCQAFHERDLPPSAAFRWYNDEQTGGLPVVHLEVVSLRNPIQAGMWCQCGDSHCWHGWDLYRHAHGEANYARAGGAWLDVRK